jgi:histidyl-tRNA synthetase
VDTIKNTLTIKSIDELKTILPSSGVIAELEGLWLLAQAYEFDDWLEFDASIVRGLSYYTGIVFEGFAKQHKLRAIFGGGRYDKLLTTYGAKQDLPACGFGFGDCVIFELLKEKNLTPILNSDIDVVVMCFDESLRTASYKVANKLRSRNVTVDVQLITNKKVSWCYAYANRIGANKCILIAPEEWLQRASVVVKELKATEQTEYEIKFDDL